MATAARSSDPVTATRGARAYRYYDLVMAAFVTVLLCANLIVSDKASETVSVCS